MNEDDWDRLSFIERLHHIVEHAARIYVRVEINGRWRSVSLIELSDEKLRDELYRLAKRHAPPTRLKQ